ncbi:hypothetical protein PG988_006578 [Apiospora saccharicola]
MRVSMCAEPGTRKVRRRGEVRSDRGRCRRCPPVHDTACGERHVLRRTSQLTRFFPLRPAKSPTHPLVTHLHHPLWELIEHKCTLCFFGPAVRRPVLVLAACCALRQCCRAANADACLDECTNHAHRDCRRASSRILQTILRRDTTLFVRPSFWTQQHLQSLHCRFAKCMSTQVSATKASAILPTTPTPDEQPNFADLNTLFDCVSAQTQIACAAQRLLGNFFPFTKTETRKLHVGTQSYELVACQTCLPPNSATAAIPLAFVNWKHIYYQSANSLQVHRAPANEPVRQLNKRRHQLLVPTPHASRMSTRFLTS